jgi:hypothetical protein
MPTTSRLNFCQSQQAIKVFEYQNNFQKLGSITIYFNLPNTEVGILTRIIRDAFQKFNIVASVDATHKTAFTHAENYHSTSSDIQKYEHKHFRFNQPICIKFIEIFLLAIKDYQSNNLARRQIQQKYYEEIYFNGIAGYIRKLLKAPVLYTNVTLIKPKNMQLILDSFLVTRYSSSHLVMNILNENERPNEIFIPNESLNKSTLNLITCPEVYSLPIAGNDFIAKLQMTASVITLTSAFLAGMYACSLFRKPHNRARPVAVVPVNNPRGPDRRADWGF